MPSSESINIGLAVVISVAFVGFAIGTSPMQNRESPFSLTPAAEAAGEVPAARTYGELRARGPVHPQDAWTSDAAALTAGLPSRGDAAVPTGDRIASLAARAERRAFDGAPPTIPHPIRQGATAECLACHDGGARLRGRTASAMSHGPLVNCTQCHVVSEAPMPAALRLEGGPFAVENSFVGRASPVQGERAWSIAPPVIPHTTFMRERCESCHGVAGADPIRSSHPYRQNCSQCHVGTAAQDLRPGDLAPLEQP